MYKRQDLTGAEGLAHMIGNHIIRTAHSSGSGNVLPLCQKELCIRSPAVTRIAGNEPAVICFLGIGQMCIRDRSRARVMFGSVP